MALGWDWGSWRGEVADIRALPDLATLTRDPALPAASRSVICDFARLDGEPLPICPRGMLKRTIAGLGGHGLDAVVAPEIEFSIFEQPLHESPGLGLPGPDATRRAEPDHLSDIALARPDARSWTSVVRRLDAVGVDWESWSSETAAGQAEINLAPTDPISAQPTG